MLGPDTRSSSAFWRAASYYIDVLWSRLGFEILGEMMWQRRRRWWRWIVLLWELLWREVLLVEDGLWETLLWKVLRWEIRRRWRRWRVALRREVLLREVGRRWWWWGIVLLREAILREVHLRIWLRRIWLTWIVVLGLSVHCRIGRWRDFVETVAPSQILDVFLDRLPMLLDVTARVSVPYKSSSNRFPNNPLIIGIGRIER
jgi:hypothetical protein